MCPSEENWAINAMNLKGSDHPKAKLHEEAVLAMRGIWQFYESLRRAASGKKLARRFEVNPSCIGDARRGDTWGTTADLLEEVHHAGIHAEIVGMLKGVDFTHSEAFVLASIIKKRLYHPEG